MIRTFRNSITFPLKYMINEGAFLEDRKKSNVVLIHKRESKNLSHLSHLAFITLFNFFFKNKLSPLPIWLYTRWFLCLTIIYEKQQTLVIKLKKIIKLFWYKEQMISSMTLLKFKEHFFLITSFWFWYSSRDKKKHR